MPALDFWACDRFYKVRYLSCVLSVLADQVDFIRCQAEFMSIGGFITAG